MERYFRDRYDSLPRPMSWMPGPPSPWSQESPSNRSLTTFKLEQYFDSQNKKLLQLGSMRMPELPESAIEKLGDNDRISQPAGVLVPFVLGKSSETDVESLIAMTRTMTVTHHKGQVSFPGGMREKSDLNIIETALRETNEEIGLDPNAFRVLDTLPPVSTRSRSSLITPVVGICSIDSLQNLSPNQQEVEQIHIIPISELTKPGSYFSEIWDFGDTSPTIHMYFIYDLDGSPVSGARRHIF